MLLNACFEAVKATPRKKSNWLSLHSQAVMRSNARLGFGIAAQIQGLLAMLLWCKVLLDATQGITINLLGNGDVYDMVMICI